MNAAVDEDPRAADIARMHESITAMVPRLEERAPRTRARRRRSTALRWADALTPGAPTAARLG